MSIHWGGRGPGHTCRRAALVDDGGAGLPAGALAYADFKGGTYHYGGNALSDFLVQNTDWHSFDPDVDIVPGTGLIGGPCLAPGLFAATWSGGVRITATLTSAYIVEGQNSFHIEAFDDPDYNQELVLIVAVDVDSPYSSRLTISDGILFAEDSDNTPITLNSTFDIEVIYGADGTISSTVNGVPLSAASGGSASAVNTVGILATPGVICEKLTLYAL